MKCEVNLDAFALTGRNAFVEMEKKRVVFEHMTTVKHPEGGYPL